MRYELIILLHVGQVPMLVSNKTNTLGYKHFYKSY